MKLINFKTVGYICLDTNKTSKYRVKKGLNVLTTKIYKSKDAMKKAKNRLLEARKQRKANKAIMWHLEIASAIIEIKQRSLAYFLSRGRERFYNKWKLIIFIKKLGKEGRAFVRDYMKLSNGKHSIQLVLPKFISL